MNGLTHKVKIYILCLVSLVLLVSCMSEPEEPVKSQEELLQDLGIDSPSDFAQLSPCKQIELYAEIGAQFLDIDHGIAIVPRWMNEEIANQPREIVANCIVNQGDKLLGQLVDYYTSEKEDRVFRIHALIYKAGDLDLIGHIQVQCFVLSAMCNENVYYSGSIASLYYAATQSDLLNFPDPDEILATFCK